MRLFDVCTIKFIIFDDYFTSVIAVSCLFKVELTVLCENEASSLHKSALIEGSELRHTCYYCRQLQVVKIS